MKTGIYLVLILAICIPANAQYNCSVSEYNGLSGDYINVTAGSGWLGPISPSTTIQPAIDQWVNSCAGYAGQKFPNIVVGGSSGYPVTVNYHDGEGPRCGIHSTYLVNGKPGGTTIDLYASFGGYSCEPVSDTLAHELGHVLGLADVSWASYCYGSIMGARAPGGTRTVTSADCAVADQDWQTTPEANAGGAMGGGGGGDGGDGSGNTQTEDLPCFPNIDCSPIIINFENGGYRLTGSNDPVFFNMSGHKPILLGWTIRGADEAFLCRDRDGDGQITTAAEFFGNFTRLASGKLAPNGFEALRELDANHDGVVDDRDPIWSQLLLWRDLNHNGISESSELAFVSNSEVLAINLVYHWTGRRDMWGNIFRYEATVVVRTGAPAGARKAPVYDVFLTPIP